MQPTIIFLHDSLGCIQTWRDFPMTVAEQTHCNFIIYDRLGYGESDQNQYAQERSRDYLAKEADVLLELIRHFAIKQPILFGHSDGGSIALLAAAKTPQLIKAIIVEAAHVFVEQVTLNGILQMKTQYLNSNLKEKLQKYHGGKTDAVFYSWANTWLSEEFRNWNIEHHLSNIICPSLIIQGKEDEYGTLNQVLSMRNGISGLTEVFLLDKVGHTPHKEASKKTLANVTDFIKNLKL